MSTLYLITIMREGIEYWSQYGGFSPNRGTAKEYSWSAASMHLRNLHSIAKHDEEHRYYADAQMEPVVREEVVV